jgi:hypothetical protein
MGRRGRREPLIAAAFDAPLGSLSRIRLRVGRGPDAPSVVNAASDSQNRLNPTGALRGGSRFPATPSSRVNLKLEDPICSLPLNGNF